MRYVVWSPLSADGIMVSHGMTKIYKEISFFSQYDLKGEAESINSAGRFLHHSRQKAAFP